MLTKENLTVDGKQKIKDYLFDKLTEVQKEVLMKWIVERNCTPLKNEWGIKDAIELRIEIIHGVVG